ncbi:MAG: prolipoprotein diacylglyceryl transferase family protein [Myxococcota bacterium]|nr:prolipoprotein diacylglyceryl transferase family protein [Myxococcota bacterium]
MDRDVDAVYVLIVAAAIAAGALARRLTKEPHAKGASGAVSLSRRQRGALLFGAVVGGTLGAKLPYVLGDPAGAISGAAWLSDGRTITWGLAGGYFGVELAKWLADVKAKTGDGFAVPLAVSIGVGRLACLWGGCCYGAPTDLPWGVDLGDGVARHPNQLYEVAFHLGMAAVLLGLARRDLLRLQRVKLYILAYMAFRFVSESWRPEPVFALGLTFYQWSALGFFVIFAGLFALDARATAPRPAAA